MGKTRRYTAKHYYASPDYGMESEYLPESDQVSVSDTPTSNVNPASPISEWVQACLQWRGLVLQGRYAHWCPHWNNLPMDETCPEWPCACELAVKYPLGLDDEDVSSS